MQGANSSVETDVRYTESGYGRKIYSAVQIADYIILTAKEKEEIYDKLKILKLIYLAHEIHLAVFDRPLFFLKK